MAFSEEVDERAMTDGFSKLSSQLAEGLATINGRVDTIRELFERHNERQDRTEIRVDRVQEEIRQLDRETSEKIRMLHQKHDESNRAHTANHSELKSAISLYRGVGITLVFVVPIVISVIMQSIGWSKP